MKKIITVVIAIVFVAVAIWTVPYWTHGSADVTVTGVDHKLMKVKGETKDVYLVFTSQETYKNVDSPAYLKFNSSDIQGRLIQGGRFHIDYYGFRIPILSMYKNITSAKKIG